MSALAADQTSYLTRVLARQSAAPQFLTAEMRQRKTPCLSVSYSELDAFRQCPLKWKLSYVDRWSAPPREGGALARGMLWHTAMQQHYETIRDFQQNLGYTRWAAQVLDTERRRSLVVASKNAMDKWLRQEAEASRCDPADAELVLWMYTGYLDLYQMDPAWEVVEVEHVRELPLGTITDHHTGREVEVMLKTRADLLVRDHMDGYQADRPLVVVDHKTGRNLSSRLEVDIDDQAGLYTWLLCESGLDVGYAVRNEARTQRNLADQPGYVGKAKPQPLLDRFQRISSWRGEGTLQRLARDALAVIETAYNLSDHTLFSAPNPDMCKWKCNFLDAHMLVRESGLPYHQVLPDFEFEQRWERH